mgnify:CR=1 FL=1
MPRFLLGLGAAVFAGFGLAFALFPTPLAAFVEIEASTPSARADVAATYGGLELGVAAVLVWMLRRGDIRTGLIVAALTFGGLGAVRLAHLAASGGAAVVWFLLAAEAVGLALALWGARHAVDGSP